jgi:hypothetical protein
VVSLRIKRVAMIGARSATSIRASGQRPHSKAVYMTAPRRVCRNTKKPLPRGGRPYMTAECGARDDTLIVSPLVVFRHAFSAPRHRCADVQLRLSLVPSFARAVAPPLRGRSAERRDNGRAPCEGTRALCDQRARLPALHLWRLSQLGTVLTGPDTGAEPPLIRAASAAVLSGPTQPFKAVPHSRDGRLPKVTRDPGYVARGAGATPCSAN